MASITATGALSADPAIAFGTGARVRSGTGVLAAALAVVTSLGNLSDTGNLVAGAAVAAGAGVLPNTGRIFASPATLAATGVRYDVGANVELFAGESYIAAVGQLGHSGTGSLSATLATLAGSGNRSKSGQLFAGFATIVSSGEIDHTSTSTALLSAPAVMAGAGNLGYTGVGDLDAGNATMAGSGAVSFHGVIPFNPPLTMTPSAVVSVLRIPFLPALTVKQQYVLGGRIPFFPLLTSAQRVVENPRASLEAVYEATGVRPSFPTLAYMRDAATPAQVDAAVPVGANFLVSPLYVGGPGDPFFDGGAGANYIGTRLRDSTSSPAYYIFRAPLEFEVVWLQPEEALYRYTLNRRTGTWSWIKYLSKPERDWAGMYVGSMFDPDKVYDYYARLIGAMGWRLAYDTEVLLDQLDPRECSPFYLPVLAAQYGLDLDFSQPIAARRSLVANAVPTFKKKGLAEAVRLRLQSMGYRGWVREIWVNPENPGNPGYFPLAHQNANGSDSCSEYGAGVDFFDAPHGYYNEAPVDYFLSSRLSIYATNQDGTPLTWNAELKNKLYQALRYDVLPPCADIRWFGSIVYLPEFGEPEVVGVSDDLIVSTGAVFTVATPIISPNGGPVFPGDPLVLSCATAGATILYSLNGSAPSLTYTGPISAPMSPSFTLRTKATKPFYVDSAEATAAFTTTAQVAAPVLAPGGSTVPSGTIVSITVPSPAGAVAHVTDTGATPTGADPVLSSYELVGGVYGVGWSGMGATSTVGVFAHSNMRTNVPLPNNRRVYFEVVCVSCADLNQNRLQIGIVRSDVAAGLGALGTPLGIGAQQFVTQIPDPDDSDVYFYNRTPNLVAGTQSTTVGTRIGFFVDPFNGTVGIVAKDDGGTYQQYSVITGLDFTANDYYLAFGGSTNGSTGTLQTTVFTDPADLQQTIPVGYHPWWTSGSVNITLKALGTKAGHPDSPVTTQTYSVSTPLGTFRFMSLWGTTAFYGRYSAGITQLFSPNSFTRTAGGGAGEVLGAMRISTAQYVDFATQTLWTLAGFTTTQPDDSTTACIYPLGLDDVAVLYWSTNTTLEYGRWVNGVRTVTTVITRPNPSYVQGQSIPTIYRSSTGRLIATWNEHDVGDVVAYANVAYSDDNGATWTVTLSTNSNFGGGNNYPIVTKSLQHNGKLWCHMICRGLGTPRVYQSSDDGLTWSYVNSPQAYQWRGVMVPAGALGVMVIEGQGSWTVPYMVSDSLVVSAVSGPSFNSGALYGYDGRLYEAGPGLTGAMLDPAAGSCTSGVTTPATASGGWSYPPDNGSLAAT